MKLTALEIKQQKFDRSLRGYDINEVHAFLSVMATEWEHMVVKNKELESSVQRLQERLEHYERVESALHETLQTAKDSAQQRLENAKKEARSKIEKAEMEAEATLREARQQRQQIRQSIMRLLDRREEIIRGIKSYLDMANESLQGFSRDDSSTFTVPRDEDVPSHEEQDMDDLSLLSTPITPQKRHARSEITGAPGLDDVDDLIDDLD